MNYCNLKKSISFVILLLLLTSTGCITVRQFQKPFFFIQMTDPQFGFFNSNKDFVKETENFEKAILAANRLRPAFVIVTGDLINRPGDSLQIAEYKRIVAKLDSSIPIYHLAGNHDITNDPKPQDIKAYRKQFGPDYFTFKHNGMLGIVLNSLYFKSPAGVQKEAAHQDKWLRQVLQKSKSSKSQSVLVFQHHPWFLTDPEEKDEYFNIPRESRKNYLSLFSDFGVSYIFSGHYHRNAWGKIGNIEMVTTGPVGKPLGKDPSGFRIVKVDGNQISHQYYNLDSIPVQIR
ncbi:Calcineurin-like phosphoesterase [Daejeonella rubra]|uniref:Calcineurin-like phosphoesterase n=1 Tax=Daejeonella rubra TaxID=990371 RepID=A0A1G9PWU8_9SPHI|nr:metallophosphoesterase [Daejeonella rubra]SDM03239.1 Calcineurin-like phosphoesterase [Daejeonella rubra]